MNVLLQFKD